MLTTLKPVFRFALAGLLLGGVLNLMGTGVALGDDAAGRSPASRTPSSLASLSSPGLQSAIQYSSNQDVNSTLLASNVPRASSTMAHTQNSKTTQPWVAPVEPNSFPPMIAKVRTENWDE